MKDFFTSTKFKVILCIAALMIGIMIYAAVASGSVISSAVGTILQPFQSASQSISTWVTTRIDMFVNAGKYYEENQELKEEIARLISEMADYETVMQENEQLREMVSLAESSEGMEFSEPCKVIGRTANDVYGSFFIDKGSKDGIEYYDPVVTANGLVGFVTEVQYTYSKVTTILSNEVSLGIYCVETGETGVTEGSYTLAVNSRLRMIYIPLECEMEAGNIVVTSGYSGLVPNGLIVGTVGDTEITESGLSRTAIITPAVDPSDLTSVYVIVDFEGKGSGYDDEASE